MSSTSGWARRWQGRPVRRTERDRWLAKVWLDVQADKRRAAAELAEEKRLRELPKKQAELVDRYRKMERDPFTQRIRAEADRAKARRRAEAERWAARRRAERAAEERAKETLSAEYGWGAGAVPAARTEAVRSAGYDRVDDLVSKGYSPEMARLACTPAERAAEERALEILRSEYGWR
jgi:membrane protein involved in colicin uptake